MTNKKPDLKVMSFRLPPHIRRRIYQAVAMAPANATIQDIVTAALDKGLPKS